MMVRKLINNRSWIVATGLIRNAMSGGLGIPCTNTVTELLYCWIELRFNRRGKSSGVKLIWSRMASRLAII